jgi:hypothetical protein
MLAFSFERASVDERWSRLARGALTTLVRRRSFVPAGQEDHRKNSGTQEEHGAFEHELLMLTQKIVVCLVVDHNVPHSVPRRFSQVPSHEVVA